MHESGLGSGLGLVSPGPVQAGLGSRLNIIQVSSVCVMQYSVVLK